MTEIRVVAQGAAQHRAGDGAGNEFLPGAPVVPDRVMAGRVVDLMGQKGGELRLVLQEREHSRVDEDLTIRQGERVRQRVAKDPESVVQVRIGRWWRELEQEQYPKFQQRPLSFTTPASPSQTCCNPGLNQAKTAHRTQREMQ